MLPPNNMVARERFKPTPIHKLWLWLIAAVGMAAGIIPHAAHGQQNVAVQEGTGLKLTEYYKAPNANQLKSVVEGARAKPLGNGRVMTQITDAKVQTFSENGLPEMVVEAPECVYNATNRAINSPGRLLAYTADGKFRIEGVGFLWLQTNSTLFISNQVHTTVHPELLESPSATNRPPIADEDVKGIEIFSERFDYAKDLGRGIYRDNVRVTGTNVDVGLQSELLTVLMPIQDRQLKTITAEKNVVMEYGMENERIHTASDIALYTAQTGVAQLTGHPSWRAVPRDPNNAEPRQGRGDELFIDRTNKIFRAAGNAWLKMPTQTTGGSSFLPGMSVSETNTVQATNQFVEIYCEQYVFHTNAASFGNPVFLAETINGATNGTMTCATLDATFGGTNDLQTMLAETNVIIQQLANSATNQFTGARAVYAATNGIMEITGKPTWQAGLREGSGNILQVNARSNSMVALGNAWMRLPAQELGGQTSTNSARVGSDPSSQAATKPTSSTAASTGNTNEFADIYADEYLVAPKSARFQRNVTIVHPQMNWRCEEVNVLSGSGPEQDVKIIAERSVNFALQSEDHQMVKGTCERAVYDYNVTSLLTNDIVRLTGNPVLETTNGTVKNSIIILDRAHNKLITPGKYVLSGSVNGANTNAIKLPKL
jgi:lipopolysaccharide export system protein LptA